MKNLYFEKAIALSGITVAFLLVTPVLAQYDTFTRADNPEASTITAEKPVQDYSYKYLPPSGREGGETIGSAVIIAGLPYYDGGNTCDNIDDYDEVCPFTGSTSPDVVYSYTPGASQFLYIDLCSSVYDTKVFVYENSYTPGSPYACNDDACGTDGFKSYIGPLAVTAGNTYYIVVDGYLGDCGEYNISVTATEGCSDCLACSTPEGEADIQDYGYDVVNGGCNQLNYTPPQEPIYSPIELYQVVCGRSNTYIGPEGGAFRDTDWYEITLTEAGTLYWSGYADFDLQLVLIYNADCNNLQYDVVQVTACNTGTLSHNVEAGTYWLWVGPSAFDGLAQGGNYNVIASLNGPPPADWCSVELPVSNWALFLAIGLIALSFVYRLWKMR